jgi:tRNA U38,U39,U40 pseudouridine synthase TruA
LRDQCRLLRARAFPILLSTEKSAVCIELVGDRFLRQMVRVLTATALRESSTVTCSHYEEHVKTINAADANILVDICHSEDR